MKVLHLGFSTRGGAGVSAQRLSDALSQLGVESEFIYFKPYSKKTARIGWFEKKLNGLVNIILSRVLKLGTLNLFPTSLLGKINRSDADIVHLHWINAGMLSVEQVAKINKPLVWSFHDMWPICGTENRVYDQRFSGGYYQNSFGINGWTWRRKNRAWGGLQVQILCPCNWLADCVRKSEIFCSQPVAVLPNGLDLDVFKPEEKLAARKKYGFPLDKKVVLFGAADPRNHNKGWDLLKEALDLVKPDDVEVVVFGANGKEQIAGLPTRWLGYIGDPMELACLYSAADVVCVPSRQETFGQTASEPQACGVPVVAFDTTGLKDVVEHKVTGYLAMPFDVADFARGIEWVLNSDAELLSKNARELAQARFADDMVARKAVEIYKGILKKEKQ